MDEVIFTIKKILGGGLMPLTFALFLLGIGSLRLMGGLDARGRLPGRGMVFLAFLILLLASLPKVSNRIVSGLESRYPAIVDTGRFASYPPTEQPRWVVVLGGTYRGAQDLPVTARLGGSTLKRVVEGIRLARALPGTQLVFTGQDDTATGPSEVAVLGDFAQEMGIPSSRIVLEGEAKDTRQHTIFLKEILGTDRFLLVSSAIHLPRAMALFEAAGMRPIAAPTAHMVVKSPGDEEWMPAVSSLGRSSLAAHEYLGTAWAKLLGQLDGLDEMGGEPEVGGEALETKKDRGKYRSDDAATPRDDAKRPDPLPWGRAKPKKNAYAPEHGPPPTEKWEGDPKGGRADDGRLKGWANPR
jgi:uncharacterized SAM-binding protein YcdF (DUF218 family)